VRPSTASTTVMSPSKDHGPLTTMPPRADTSDAREPTGGRRARGDFGIHGAS
jgi:hypothetical protein